MNPSEVHAYLNSFTNFESRLDKLRPEDFALNRIEKFLDLAGEPGKDLKIVHVAGTKGKGSVCAFLSRILQEAGYRTGLYTSPHLHHVNERIRILDKDDRGSHDPFCGSITDEALAGILAFLRPYAAQILNEGNILTYFEVMTVAALCYFAQARVDVVILETGLGGRLDATNALDSSIAIITQISLDHTRILGTTLDKIASEKAGIIKNSHQKVVLAPQEKEAMEVILKRCREFGVHPVIAAPEKYEDLKLGLKGRHQRINAAVAVEGAVLLRTMGFAINDDAIREGLQHVCWPGRFEVLRTQPDVIVDGAHNGASAEALSRTLAEEYPDRRTLMILGVSRDKDVSAICRPLKDQAAFIYLTKASHARAHVFTEAEGRDFFGGKPFAIIDNVKEALAQALQTAGPQDVIVITGSLFITAEARERVYVPI